MLAFFAAAEVRMNWAYMGSFRTYRQRRFRFMIFSIAPEPETALQVSAHWSKVLPDFAIGIFPSLRKRYRFSSFLI